MITGTIPPEIGQLTKLKLLRAPPASPTPGAPREPPLGVAGTSKATRSSARSRPSSASSRSWTTCEFSPRPRCPARRATDPRRRRYLENNQITGTFPVEACDVAWYGCGAKAGNPGLVAPCGTEKCCDWESIERLACPSVGSITILGKSYDHETTTELRAPPASLTRDAADDRPSASQVPLRQGDHRPDPD